METELRALVREAAENWLEQTETDRRVLDALQSATIMWCVTYLWQKGHGPAGATLLALVPQARAEQLLGETG
jgi:hypothetical protein